jgi:hypothetical protein
VTIDGRGGALPAALTPIGGIATSCAPSESESMSSSAGSSGIVASGLDLGTTWPVVSSNPTMGAPFSILFNLCHERVYKSCLKSGLS